MDIRVSAHVPRGGGEMRVKFEQALDTLATALRHRLNALIAHLRQAPWNRRQICFPNRMFTQPPLGRLTTHTEQQYLRYDTFTWAHKQLEDSDTARVTIGEAIRQVQLGTEQLIRSSVDMIAACVTELVAKELRIAVLKRSRLVDHWTWPLEASAGALLHLLLSVCPTLPPSESLIAAWPADVGSAPVAVWAENWLDRNAITENVAALMKRTQRVSVIVFDLHVGLPYRSMATSALALVYLLEQKIKDEQSRSFIAIDTCKEHTKFVEAWRDLPKGKNTTVHSAIIDDRLELILPDTKEKRHFQLSLLLPDDPVANQVGAALREWRGWRGLRHWVVFQSLITSNNRLGWVRWTVDEHLKAMGYQKHRRKRLNLRRGAAKMVELFTQIEMGVYDDKGRMRERRPLVLKSNTYERLEGSEWELEGLELKLNPLLYRGVRDPKTGQIGKNWWPTPKELAYIDHDKFGPAISLGIVLPARWRMQLAKSNVVYVDLKGDSLLRAAGLPYRSENVVATWRSVERNLSELQRRNGLGRWEWQGEPRLSTVCRLYAPVWAIDRIAHGVPPRELPVLIPKNLPQKSARAGRGRRTRS